MLGISVGMVGRIIVVPVLMTLLSKISRHALDSLFSLVIPEVGNNLFRLFPLIIFGFGQWW